MISAKSLYSHFLFNAAEDGGSNIAYASKLDSKIDLKSTVAWEYKFSLYDCANGSEVTMENVTVAGGGQSLDKPGNPGSELAVYIERIGGL